MQKKTNPLISILVPVYGVADYIERCAVSLFGQTYENIEYVFVDDCTPDESIKILRSVLERYSNRASHVVIPTHDKNRGLAVARNTAVRHATGDFVLWVDADDYVDVNMVEKVVAKQQESDADIVCFDARILFSNHYEFQRNSDYYDNKDFTLKLLSDTAPHQLWGHLIRRSLYIKNGIQAKEGVNQGEDFCVMPCLAYFASRIVSLHELLYFYDKTRATSYSNNFSLKSEEQIWNVYRILNNFFNGKGVEYEQAIQTSEVESIARRLKNLSQIDDDKGYYNKLLKRLSNINRNYWISVPFYNRVVLYLKKKSIVAIYSQLLYKINRIKYCIQ